MIMTLFSTRMIMKYNDGSDSINHYRNCHCCYRWNTPRNTIFSPQLQLLFFLFYPPLLLIFTLLFVFRRSYISHPSSSSIVADSNNREDIMKILFFIFPQDFPQKQNKKRKKKKYRRYFYTIMIHTRLSLSFPCREIEAHILCWILLKGP